MAKALLHNNLPTSGNSSESAFIVVDFNFTLSDDL